MCNWPTFTPILDEFSEWLIDFMRRFFMAKYVRRYVTTATEERSLLVCFDSVLILGIFVIWIDPGCFCFSGRKHSPIYF